MQLFKKKNYTVVLFFILLDGSKKYQKAKLHWKEHGYIMRLVAVI